MSISDIEWFNLLIGIVAGMLIFKFSRPIADNLQHWPIINLARDSNNPFVYKVLGVVTILLSVIFFVLTPLISKGYITY